MTVTIFVNEEPVTVRSDIMLEEAVSAFDQRLGAAVTAGSAYVTDGVGRRLDTSTKVFAGAIYRIIHSAAEREESTGN